MAIGAWVTIALLAIDPFLQSVIDYHGNDTLIDGHNATVGVATNFDTGSWFNTGGVYGDGELGNITSIMGTCVIPYEDKGMSATTMLGFIDGSTSRLSQPPSLSCATGNCSWTYSTLAICSKCEDITEFITTETVELSFFTSGTQDPVLENCEAQSYFSINNYTRYRLVGSYDLSFCAPEGILEASGPDSDEPGESGFGRTKKVRLAAGSVESPQDTYRFKTADTLLSSFAVLQVSDDYWARKTAFNAAGPTATECSLSLCTQLYEAEMKLGELTERLISSSYEREPDSFSPIDLVAPLAEDPGISLARQGPHYESCGGQDNMTGGGLQVLINRTDLQLHLSHEADVQVQTTFNITHKAIDTMMHDLTTNLAPQIVDFLYPSRNIPETFGRAARLMSYHMREATDAGSSAARGETRQWVTYIRVRWAYMTLPIALAAAVAVFAAGVAARSWRLGLNDAKGDTVSSMLLVDGHTRDVLRAEPRGARRDVVVLGTPLRLARDEKGLCLNRMAALPTSSAGNPTQGAAGLPC